MPSQFFGLNIAYTGLLGANAGLNTTANNIANAETEGYSRQEVNQVAAAAIRTFTTYGCAGAGVDVLTIERIHDDFYDNKYWANNSRVGEFNMKQYYMTQIEDYFKDDDTTEGFTTVFNKMMDALQEVKKNPASDSTKAQFVGLADNLTQYFNNMAVNMELVQKDVNAEIKVKVDAINSLADEIAALNKQINVIELSGSRANELRDRRALLVDDLSKIVSVEVGEYPIVDSNDPTRETGGNQYIIKIAGGHMLVDTDESKNLKCIARQSDNNSVSHSEKVNQTDIDGLYDVYWISNKTTEDVGDKFNLYNPLLGGDLMGLVQMRDGNNGENFRGTIESVGTPDMTTGTQIVTVSTDLDYLMDLDKSNMSDNGGIIALGNQEFYYDSWTYSYDATTNKCTYEFVINTGFTGETVTGNKQGKEAEIGNVVKYQGIPYYQQQMNEWVRIFSNAVNSILRSGYTSDGKAGMLMFTGDEPTTNTQINVTSEYNDELGNNITATIKDTDDSYYRVTAKNFTVHQSLINNSNLLATKKDPAEGSDDYSLVADFINMTNDSDIASYRGAATCEFLTCMLSDVALNGNRAQTFYDNYDNIGKSINNQRTAISGVDTDDEAVNLVKYQNAYTLASKMIQTLTEVYDRLILQTGV